MEPRWLNKFIAGLGEFLVPRDIERIDEALFSLGGDEQEYNIPCEIRITTSSLADTVIRFSCRDESQGMDLMISEGQIQFASGNLIDGLIENIQIPPYGAGIPIKLLEADEKVEGVRRRLNLKGRASNDGASLGQLGRHPRLNARLPSGELVKNMVLQWDQESDYGVFEGMATITVVNDIEALQSAIRKLAKKSENSLSDALGYGAFRRASLLPEILADLGLQPEDWCCIHDVGFPPITAIGE